MDYLHINTGHSVSICLVFQVIRIQYNLLHQNIYEAGLRLFAIVAFAAGLIGVKTISKPHLKIGEPVESKSLIGSTAYSIIMESLQGIDLTCFIYLSMQLSLIV